ncbi:MAG: RICIN domain-containing protein [Capsulimonadaceae bacterium]
MVRPGKMSRIHEVGAVLLPAAMLMAFATSPAFASPPTGYSLTWSDEFNGAVGSAPNSANWNYDTGIGPNNDGWGNWEQETYVTDLAHCHIISDSAATDGKSLQIEATNDDNWTTYGFHSARLNSIGKVTPTYGYVEVRAKNPVGQGIWPAFWFLGTNMPSVGWPACGEMDTMEIFGQNDGTNMGSFHMGTSSAEISWTASYTLAGGALFDGAYHTFGILWSPSAVTQFVDGVQYESWASTSPGWAFNHAFYMILNLAVGGIPPGDVTQSGTSFPQYLDVDYIRIYEPSTITGTHTLSPQCATGSRLDDSGGGTSNGNKIDIWASNGTGAQSWTISSSGVSPSGDYNLAAEGPYCLQASSTSSGSAAELWACDGASAQSWNIVGDVSPSGYYQLHPATNAALCLDVTGAGTANGTVVETYTCNFTNAQQWTIN